MSATAPAQASSRAVPSLLVQHVSRLEAGFADRPSAADRLTLVLGPELTARLLSALAGNHGVRRLL
jgi:hypothetical protein